MSGCDSPEPGVIAAIRRGGAWAIAGTVLDGGMESFGPGVSGRSGHVKGRTQIVGF